VHVPVPGGTRDRVTAPKDAQFLRTDPEFAIFRVGHGEWSFTSTA
jgi:alpha-L-rhamnosidase